MVARTELVLVSDSIHHSIELIDVGADADGFLFNAGIDFRNDHDGGIHGARVLANLAQEGGEGGDSEIHPLAKIRVREIAELQIPARIEIRLLLESGDGKIVETGPGVLPALEVSHPVRNIHINAVDAGCGDLANALHINFAPWGGVGTDPDVFITWANPKCRAAGEDGGLACEFALKPVRMVLDDGMRRFCGVAVMHSVPAI